MSYYTEVNHLNNTNTQTWVTLQLVLTSIPIMSILMSYCHPGYYASYAQDCGYNSFDIEVLVLISVKHSLD